MPEIQLHEHRILELSLLLDIFATLHKNNKSILTLHILNAHSFWAVAYYSVFISTLFGPICNSIMHIIDFASDEYGNMNLYEM